jgi:long-chain acyl-CoA synthetase
VVSIGANHVSAAQAHLTAAGQPFEIAEHTVCGESWRCFVNAPQTLVDVLATMRAHGPSQFLTVGDRRWTYDRFFADADALAATLQCDLGVAPGDRVAIAMRNCSDWLVTFAAAVLVGAVVVPVNSWGSAEELVFTLHNARPRVLAADLPRVEHAAAELAEAGVVVLFSSVDGDRDRLDQMSSARPAILDFDNAVAAGAGRDFLPHRPEPADTALLLYTSGSTGRPKGVITRHVAVGQILMNMTLAGLLPLALQGSAVVESTVPQANLVTVPLFHVTGLFGGVLLPGLLGQRIVLMHRWDAEAAMAIIESERITMLSTVPAILKDLVCHPRLADYDCSSVSRAALAGAATPADLPGLLRDRLGVNARAAGYGMTESGSVGSAMSGAVFDFKPTSAGLISPIVEVRTVDRFGRILPPEAEGEIQLRGITVTPGYWRLDDLTRVAFTADGWLRTGDLGRVDTDGFLYITGRIKEIVVRGGENIAPVEIENVAYRHPAAKEVAVFGVPDNRLGEELAMVCHRQPASTLTTKELRAHLAAALPRFKVPKYIAVTDEPLPRNASDKIHRLRLREAFITHDLYRAR